MYRLEDLDRPFILCFMFSVVVVLTACDRFASAAWGGTRKNKEKADADLTIEITTTTIMIITKKVC